MGGAEVKRALIAWCCAVGEKSEGRKMNPSQNFVPAFQQGGGPGYEHTAKQAAGAATGAHGGVREHRFSPYVDNGG